MNARSIRDMTTADHNAACHRSYDHYDSGRTFTPVVRTLTATAEAYGPGHPLYVRIDAGERVMVRSLSNAGFRGIEATITTTDGRTIHGVSAGWLR
jgi:hypothetical protein